MTSYILPVSSFKELEGGLGSCFVPIKRVEVNHADHEGGISSSSSSPSSSR